MPSTAPTKSKTASKKTAMSQSHKAALAEGREQGRVVRRYLEALESAKPRRGRKRTTESITKRLNTIDDRLHDGDALSRLHLTQEKHELEAELSSTEDTVDLVALEKEFIKVARAYGDRKGIAYSAWRSVGVPAPVLQQAKIARTRG
jgi:hypothetical protein